MEDLDLPERRNTFSGSRQQEGGEGAQMCPCGEAKRTRARGLGERWVFKEERDVLGERKTRIDECCMEKFGTLENSDKIDRYDTNINSINSR